MNPCKHNNALQKQQQQRSRYMSLRSKRTKKHTKKTRHSYKQIIKIRPVLN